MSFENLPNEFFHELFDYLDAYHIYWAFSDLNHRFERLLTSASVLLRVKLDASAYDAYWSTGYEWFVFDNAHHIYSLSLESDEYYSEFSIDSSFARLESLLFRHMEYPIVCSLLAACTSLPRLFSLTIDMGVNSKGITDIYQSAFALPHLTYLKCSAEDNCRRIALPFASPERVTSVEYLVVKHSCVLQELAAILSYAPQLRHLNFSHDNNKASVLPSPIRLLNLTTVMLNLSQIEFSDLERLLLKLDCPLRTLSVTNRSNDDTYLDAARWQALLAKTFPQLEYFYLECVEENELEDGISYMADLNRFKSSFWLDRKWILDTEVRSFSILHRIRPTRKQWYDTESSTDCVNSARLVFACPCTDDNPTLSIPHVLDISTATQFHHFECQTATIGFNALINITNRFAELDSVKLHSLTFPSTKARPLETLIGEFVRNNNRITKIQLETMTEIEEIYFLLKLCRRLSYLHINSVDTVDVRFFVEDVVDKLTSGDNANFRFLSFRSATVNETTVQELKEMLKTKKLIPHCTIDCQLGRVSLQWGR